MTNKEYYKEQILDLACKGMRFAFANDENVPCACRDLDCNKCIFSNEYDESCEKNIIKWCNAEYVEPCPFEKDDVVEVSNDGKRWCIRHFSHIGDGMYYAFVDGVKSTEVSDVCPWRYCRKYGTFGRLTN